MPTPTVVVVNEQDESFVRAAVAHVKRTCPDWAVAAKLAAQDEGTAAKLDAVLQYILSLPAFMFAVPDVFMYAARNRDQFSAQVRQALVESITLS